MNSDEFFDRTSNDVQLGTLLSDWKQTTYASKALDPCVIARYVAVFGERNALSSFEFAPLCFQPQADLTASSKRSNGALQH